MMAGTQKRTGGIARRGGAASTQTSVPDRALQEQECRKGVIGRRVRLCEGGYRENVGVLEVRQRHLDQEVQRPGVTSHLSRRMPSSDP